MELKYGMGDVFEGEFFKLLIAPLMELKFISDIDNDLFVFTFNRTAYGIEIIVNARAYDVPVHF